MDIVVGIVIVASTASVIVTTACLRCQEITHKTDPGEKNEEELHPKEHEGNISMDACYEMSIKRLSNVLYNSIPETMSFFDLELDTL